MYCMTAAAAPPSPHTHHPHLVPACLATSRGLEAAPCVLHDSCSCTPVTPPTPSPSRPRCLATSRGLEAAPCTTFLRDWLLFGLKSWMKVLDAINLAAGLNVNADMDLVSAGITSIGMINIFVKLQQMVGQHTLLVANHMSEHCATPRELSVYIANRVVLAQHKTTRAGAEQPDCVSSLARLPRALLHVWLLPFGDTHRWLPRPCRSCRCPRSTMLLLRSASASSRKLASTCPSCIRLTH